jgi:Rrf2 family protein
MLIPQKSQYALRAVLELAKRYDRGPIKTAAIAEAQSIPPRFLSVILSQLKQAGFVASRRGNDGGYELARSPRALTVREVLEFTDGPVIEVRCLNVNSKEECTVHSSCVFWPMWKRVEEAVSEIYEATSFEDLVEQERRVLEQYTPTYAI